MEGCTCINFFTELALPWFGGYFFMINITLRYFNVGLYPNFTPPFNPILFTKVTHPKDNF